MTHRTSVHRWLTAAAILCVGVPMLPHSEATAQVRVRKNYRSMTSAERKTFRDALKALKDQSVRTCTLPAGSVGNTCSVDADCDSAPAAGDGTCGGCLAPAAKAGFPCSVDKNCDVNPGDGVCTESTTGQCTAPAGKVGDPCGNNAHCDVVPGDGRCGNRKCTKRIRGKNCQVDADCDVNPGDGVCGCRYANTYDKYVCWHADCSCTGVESQHGRPQLDPWHRELIRRFELEIRALGGPFAAVTIPYWVWTEPFPRHLTNATCTAPGATAGNPCIDDADCDGTAGSRDGVCLDSRCALPAKNRRNPCTENRDCDTTLGTRNGVCRSTCLEPPASVGQACAVNADCDTLAGNGRCGTNNFLGSKSVGFFFSATNWKTQDGGDALQERSRASAVTAYDLKEIRAALNKTPYDSPTGTCTAPAARVGRRCVVSSDCNTPGNSDGTCGRRCRAPGAKVGRPCNLDADCDSSAGSNDGRCGVASEWIHKTEANGFRSTAERRHDLMHGWIGGDMSTELTTADDPTFWLSHAYLDCLWATWEQLHPDPPTDHYRPDTLNNAEDAAAPTGDDADDVMGPWNDKTIRDVLDTASIEGAGVGYVYEPCHPTPTSTAATPTPIVTPTPAKKTCNAGKMKCLGKRTACLLKVYGKSIGKGELEDADKLQKCRDKFYTSDAVTNGCVEKIEAKADVTKPESICTDPGDGSDLETEIDAFVDDLFFDIDNDFPDTVDANKCTAGKASCAAKASACLMGVVANALKKGETVAPDKFEKCKDKFDGGTDPTKGCFEKLEGKEDETKPETLCDHVHYGGDIEEKIDFFIDKLAARMIAIF